MFPQIDIPKSCYDLLSLFVSPYYYYCIPALKMGVRYSNHGNNASETTSAKEETFSFKRNTCRVFGCFCLREREKEHFCEARKYNQYGRGFFYTTCKEKNLHIS